MAPVPPPPMAPDPMGMGPEGMPDLSHLSEEERQIILQVLQRQKAEEQQEEEASLGEAPFQFHPLNNPQIAQKGDRELWDIEKQIQERKENAQKLIGTQDDAICQICQKTKFADGIGHKARTRSFFKAVSFFSVSTANSGHVLDVVAKLLAKTKWLLGFEWRRLMFLFRIFGHVHSAKRDNRF